MVLNGFIWPYLAYQIAIRSNSSYRAEIRNLLLDCLFAGAWVVVMKFSLLPSLLLLSMVAMNSVAAKGVRFLLQGLLANLIGASIAIACIGLELTRETPLEVIWACLPMLVTYPLVVGWTSYGLAEQLARQRKALSVVSSFDDHMLIPHDYWLFLLGRLFHRCRCGSAYATLVCIRLDDFSSLQNKHGEFVMEALDTRLGHLIRTSVRTTDLISKKCPGEFVVLMPQSKAQGAAARIKLIEDTFSQSCGEGAGLPEVCIYLGVAEFAQGSVAKANGLK